MSRLLLVSAPLMRHRVGSSDALTNTDHTIELTAFAVLALERTAALRPKLSEYEPAAIGAGRRRILLDQAYAHITSFDTRSARESLRELRRKEGRLGGRGMGPPSAAHVPPVVPKVLAHAKRALRRGG